MLTALYEWIMSLFRATAPQRADFESANKGLQELIALLKSRIADMDAEFQTYRKYTGERIRELQAEAAECREFREKDLEMIASLKTEVRSLRDEVAQLRHDRR